MCAYFVHQSLNACWGLLWWNLPPFISSVMSTVPLHSIDMDLVWQNSWPKRFEPAAKRYRPTRTILQGIDFSRLIWWCAAAQRWPRIQLNSIQVCFRIELLRSYFVCNICKTLWKTSSLVDGMMQNPIPSSWASNAKQSWSSVLLTCFVDANWAAVFLDPLAKHSFARKTWMFGAHLEELKPMK